MTTLATAPDPLHARKAWLPHVDSGIGTLALLIVISALVVLPPFFYLTNGNMMNFERDTIRCRENIGTAHVAVRRQTVDGNPCTLYYRMDHRRDR